MKFSLDSNDDLVSIRLRPIMSRVCLSGRQLSTVRLQPHTTFNPLTTESTKVAKEKTILLLVLHGSVVTASGEFRQNTWLRYSQTSSIYAGSTGCSLGIISWNGEQQTVTQGLQQPELIWYDKYDAWVGALDLESDNNALPASWSGYTVKLPPESGEIQVHIHYSLKNLIFIQGSPAVTAGYLVTETPKGYQAFPVKGGDLVLVQPGIEHNLVAIDVEQPLQFFVFNDVPSDYQAPETSDYHVTKHVAQSALTKCQRLESTPLFIHAGVKGDV